MSLVVIGTATEGGKTVVSALSCARYRRELPLAYWKPVASGSVEGRDVEVVVELSGAEVLDEVYLLAEPLSPHLAARLEETRVDPDRLLAAWRAHRRQHPGRALVVEGVGGLHVPLDDDGYLFSDLAVALGLPVVVVARTRLGTINHTLLTLEALRARQLEILGVVLDGEPNPENRKAIRDFGEVEILGQLLPMDPLDRPSLETWARTFDPEGRIGEALARAEKA
ncbi:MAG: dethiobiotin synthase [Holophagales bacterium]|nr:dethiobiotin synthase [Holophagales bacterium]